VLFGARDLAQFVLRSSAVERAIEAHRRPWSVAVLARLSPAIAIGLAFSVVLVVLLIHFDKAASLHHGSVLFGAAVMFAFGGVQAKRRGWTSARALVADWLPFILCLWVYENLHDLTMLIRPDVVDAQLAAADARLLGTQPTIALQHIVHPVLTDYLTLCYSSYFFIPPLFAGWLWMRGHTEHFRELQLMMLLVFYFGFIGYVSVPATGPRYELVADFRVQLHGWYYDWCDHLMNGIEAVARDCFPSLHTAVSTTWLVCAYRWRRLIPSARVVLPILTVITVSLWFSTVYLRYHWVVDVIGGWALALLVQILGRWMHRRWPRRA